MRRDSKEDENLLPALKAFCGQAFDKRNDPTFSWGDFAKLDRATVKKSGSNENMIKVLKLFSFLQIKMHLFRYLGETEFLNFHPNKPFETEVSCDLRRSSVPTFSWSSHILAPEFCGNSVYRELGPPFCRCAMSNCSQHWSRPAGEGLWAIGQASAGLDGLTPVTGTMQSYLKEVLQWSRFSSICPNILDATAAAKIPGKTTKSGAAKLIVRSCHDSISTTAISNKGASGEAKENAGWSYGDLTGWPDGLIGATAQRHCHQRLHSRGRHVYLTGGTCGHDAPLLTLTLHGMHAPLPLCPESSEKLKRRENPHMDDNLLLAALNVIFFSAWKVSSSWKPEKQSKKGRGVLKQLMRGGSATATSSGGRNSLPGEQVAILDPLFLHSISKCTGDVPVSMEDILGSAGRSRILTSSSPEASVNASESVTESTTASVPATTTDSASPSNARGVVQLVAT
jgi:hypothetical protein